VAELGRADPQLSAAQATAVDFATSIISDPASLTDDLRARLHEHFTDDQIVELALDTMKWSYQKFAVALRLDHEVRPGELTDLVFDDDGNWVRPDRS
jgi:hypothetical protein